LKIVLDTNVLISALLGTGGPPAAVLDLILDGRVKLLIEERIFLEYSEVLDRPRFEIPAVVKARVLNYLWHHGEHVLIDPLEEVLPDPDDLPFLETAVSGGADAIVTGNARHFPSGRCRGIPVMGPAEFLDLWERKGRSG
jgi:uncharacterized protein